MKRSILLTLILSLGITAFCQTHNTTISAPSEVSVSVFQGFAESTEEIMPACRKENGGTVRYEYDLKPGLYHFISGGYGYLSLKKNFTVGNRPVSLNANPGRRGEKGYQQTAMTYAYTDEVIEKCLGIDRLRKYYPKVMTTPGFDSGKPVGEYTTQREMEEYLARLDSGNPNMYTYTAGYSTLERRIPLAVFTCVDIKGMTMEEAGRAISSDARPTIFLHAQIHGHESSPGEGALAVCAELCGKYGTEVLPHVNVIVLPRINCDGAQIWMRGTTVCKDMNRDNLMVCNPEVKAAHNVYNLFSPAVVVDMHEASVRNYSDTEGYLEDAGITVGGNQNNSLQFNELQKEMMRYVERKGSEIGLRYWEYTQAGYSDQSPLHASHYYALRSSATFLVETTSRICQKRTSFARRVFTQFFAVRALIEYTIANSGKVTGTCRADREYITSDRSPFILRHGQNSEAYTYSRTIFNLTDGSVKQDTMFAVRFYEIPLVTRSRPSAYVIPKDARNIGRILEIARYNGISYEELPAGTEMTLRQYTQNPKWHPAVQHTDKFVPDSVEKCALIEPQKTVFNHGAYIFRTAQPNAIVLMFLMEPDVIKTDTNPITLIQADLLGVDELYRME